MAAALLNYHGQGRVHVRSAGSAPAEEINAQVIEAMAEAKVTTLILVTNTARSTPSR